MEVVLALPGAVGSVPDLQQRFAAHPQRRVIAVDGGYRLAREHGLAVDELVGDLDSISADDLDHATSAGVSIERWPRHKDFTDLEIALQRAEALGASSICCVGGAGGRVDHLFTNLFVLAGAAARLGAVPVRWIAGDWTAEFVTPSTPLEWQIDAGRTFSVLTPLGSASGVTIAGAAYPLDRASIAAGSGLGVSNRTNGGHLSVSLESGLLAVIVPVAAHPSGPIQPIQSATQEDIA